MFMKITVATMVTEEYVGVSLNLSCKKSLKLGGKLYDFLIVTDLVGTTV